MKRMGMTVQPAALPGHSIVFLAFDVILLMKIFIEQNQRYILFLP